MTAAPTARDVLLMVADWNAAEREAEEARALYDDAAAIAAEKQGEKLCRQLLRLNPVQLRALAAPASAEPERGMATVEVGQGFYAGGKALILRAISEDLAVATFDYCPRAEAETLIATPGPAEAELEAEIEHHYKMAAQHSENKDLWWVHFSLETALTDKLAVMKREAHWRAKLAVALADAPGEGQ